MSFLKSESLLWNRKVVMRKLLLLATLILAGCSPTVEDVSSDFILPADLRAEGCGVIELGKGGMSTSRIFLIKCNNGYIGTHSAVPSDDGKSTLRNSVVFQ